MISLQCCIAPFKAAISVTIRPVNKDNVSHPGSLTAALQLTELIGGQSLSKDGGKLVRQRACWGSQTTTSLRKEQN